MSDINNLITPCNIQGELIKNKIEQNNLMFEAFKEQKYNELLKENQKLKIEISARETVCDELQERINKAVEYIESSALEINTRDYGMLTVCNSDDILNIIERNSSDEISD